MARGELSAHKAAELRAAPFTYDEVGASALGRQAGYDWLERSATLVRRDWEGACRDLLTWRLHERAGLRVQASESPLRQDTVVLLHLGVGPLALPIPCRVVYVVDEPTRCGFAYGTLPGHAESGEERFVLERQEDGRITVTISAFSNPATRLASLGGPVTKRVQQVMTTRYLRALDRT